MILNMLVGVGGTASSAATKSVTFYGGVGETLTLYGETNETVTLNSNGIGTATVPLGNYLILGSLSKEILPAGKSVTITSSTSTVAAYPDGAIFWYGNGDSESDSLWSKCGGFKSNYVYHPSTADEDKIMTYTLTSNTNNFTFDFSYDNHTSSSWEVASAQLYAANKLSTSGYSSLNVTGSKIIGSFYTTNSLVENFTAVSSSSDMPVVLTPANYFVYYANPNIQPYTHFSGNLTINAIWLE